MPCLHSCRYSQRMTMRPAHQTVASSPEVPAVSPQPIRVMLADADIAFMSSLQNYLTASSGYIVVAKVETCQEVLLWCEELQPQILVLDWHLMFDGLLPAETKGVAFLQRVKGLKNAPAVIVAARLSLDEHRHAALVAGADDFMPKTKFPQLIRPLIQRLVPRL